MPAATPERAWVVACLCAGWCDACKLWRPAFEALAAQHPQVRWRWIDIEDEAALVGDLDVENFPTVVIASRPGGPAAGPVQLHFGGVLLPRAGDLERLLLALQADAQAGVARPAAVTPGAQAATQALAAALLA